MTSIRQILSRSGVPLDHTVYRESGMLDYPIPTVGSFDLMPQSLGDESYEKIIEYQKRHGELTDHVRTDAIDEEISRLTRQARSLIRGGLSSNSPEVVALGKKKKEFRSEKRRIEQRAGEQALSQVFGKEAREDEIWSVCFKESMYAVDFSELSQLHASWRGEDYLPLEKRPWFVSSLKRVKELILSQRPIGIEGGSCLFGTDEMRFILTLKNGELHRFDFNTLQEIEEGKPFFHGTTSELFEFMRDRGSEVIRAETDCPKEKITIDEYEAVNFLFLLAKGFQAKLIVTIPDMSYEKTFMTLFSSLPKEIYEPFHREFLSECQRMTAKSISLISNLAERHGIRDYEIFYSGNERLCRLFHEKRSPFLEKYSQKFLTRRNGMMDALTDYICMPAMPLYLYGIRDVIEVNRLEECPSIEKCRRIHRSALNLCDILYTQKMGTNGVTAGFYADMKNKEYIDEKNFC